MAAGKIAQTGALAKSIATAGRAADALGKGVGAVGAAMDPLTLPGKTVAKAATKIVPKAFHDTLPKLATPVSRLKTAVGIGATQQATEEYRKK